MSSYDPNSGGFERPPGWYEPPAQPPPYHGPGPGGGYDGGQWDEEAGREGPPWEQREELGTVKSMFQTLWEVLIHPGDTFATAKRTGGLGNPLLYAICCGAFMIFMFLVLRLAYVFGSGQSLEDAVLGAKTNLPPESTEELRKMLVFLEGNLPLVAAGLFICLFTFFPMILAMQVFVSSAIVHVGLMIVGGAKRDFETTFRVIAYVYPSSLVLNLIPFCGGIIGPIWSLVAKIVGLKEMHETDTWRVVVAVLLPLLLCCGCGIAVAAIVLPGFLSAWQQGINGSAGTLGP